MQAMDGELYGTRCTGQGVDGEDGEDPASEPSGGSESVLHSTFVSAQDDAAFDPTDETAADYHLLSNLLESHAAQNGPAGPAANLLSQLGVQLNGLAPHSSGEESAGAHADAGGE